MHFVLVALRLKQRHQFMKTMDEFGEIWEKMMLFIKIFCDVQWTILYVCFKNGLLFSSEESQINELCVKSVNIFVIIFFIIELQTRR